MSKKCLYTTLTILSVLFLILSVCTIIIFANIEFFIHQQIEQQAPFVLGSKPLYKWANPAEDTSFKTTIYLFNVINPDQVQKGHIPIVREVGPYEFKQKKKWTLYDWQMNDTQLSYDVTTKFFHDHTCKGDLNDTVTVLNVPIISFVNLAKIEADKKPLLRLAIKLFMRQQLNQHGMFVTQTVGDLLFNGYRDDFTTKLGILMNLLQKMGVNLSGPSAITKDGYFSLLGQTNNSNSGLRTIDTGKADLNKLGRLLRIDGDKKFVDCWTGRCASIDGTDGVIHHPFVKDNDILPVFVSEMNRTVFLGYERDSQYKDIPTKRFLLSNNTFASPSKNPFNKCFYPNNDSYNQFSGIFPVGRCNFDVPIVFSNPHFYQADDIFRQQIYGFKPNKANHESYVDIASELGMVINGRQTVQLNLDTDAYSYFMDIEGVTRKIFPVLWLAISGSAGPSSIRELKTELYDKVANAKKYLIISSSVFFSAFIIFVLYLTFDCTKRWNSRNEDTLHFIDHNESLNNMNSNDSRTKSANKSDNIAL